MNGIIPRVAYKGSAISYGPRGFDHSAGLPSENMGLLVTAELMKCCNDTQTQLLNDPNDRSAHLCSSLTKGVCSSSHSKRKCNDRCYSQELSCLLWEGKGQGRVRAHVTGKLQRPRRTPNAHFKWLPCYLLTCTWKVGIGKLATNKFLRYLSFYSAYTHQQLEVSGSQCTQTCKCCIGMLLVLDSHAVSMRKTSS